MDDEEGYDPKLILVPLCDVDGGHVRDVQDLPGCVVDKIVAFFNSYKLHDKEKWSKVKGVEPASHATKTLAECRHRWQKKKQSK
jgi:inorganic pyrophosphatase